MLLQKQKDGEDIDKVSWLFELTAQPSGNWNLCIERDDMVESGAKVWTESLKTSEGLAEVEEEPTWEKKQEAQCKVTPEKTPETGKWVTECMVSKVS